MNSRTDRNIDNEADDNEIFHNGIVSFFGKSYGFIKTDNFKGISIFFHIRQVLTTVIPKQGMRVVSFKVGKSEKGFYAYDVELKGDA